MIADKLAEFESKYPSKKFVSKDIKKVCFAWWLYTPQGRRRVVFDRKLQGQIAMLLRDYEPVHLIDAINKYGKCLRNPETYWYGHSTYTLEHFLGGKGGDILTKFTRDPLESFQKSKPNNIEYK